jgi:hypothetical protein
MGDDLPGFIPRVLQLDDVSLLWADEVSQLWADEAVLNAMVDGTRGPPVAELPDGRQPAGHPCGITNQHTKSMLAGLLPRAAGHGTRRRGLPPGLVCEGVRGIARVPTTPLPQPSRPGSPTSINPSCWSPISPVKQCELHCSTIYFGLFSPLSR